METPAYSRMLPWVLGRSGVQAVEQAVELVGVEVFAAFVTGLFATDLRAPTGVGAQDSFVDGVHDGGVNAPVEVAHGVGYVVEG